MASNGFEFENPDDESLPITKCACGRRYYPWNKIISIYEDEPKTMPCCGRKVYFRQTIEVIEVK